jgi:hypothetical protein
MIAFAQPDEEIMIDYILLSEVEKIQVMEVNGEELGSMGANNENGFEHQERCSFVIKTALEGHNGGRDYYLRAGSAEMCQKLVQSLNHSAQTARFMADAHSRFAKSQFFVRQIYLSSPFHYTSAFLIAAVRSALNKVCARQPAAPLSFSFHCSGGPALYSAAVLSDHLSSCLSLPTELPPRTHRIS